MGNQKQEVLELVEAHRGKGRSVSEVLGSVGVARSSYYRWKKSRGEKTDKRQRSYELTGEERQMIEAVKESVSRVPPSADPGSIAAARSVSIGLGDQRAFKGAGVGRTL
jgi:hypothetical protein